MTQPMLYAFDQNHESIRYINSALGGVKALHQDIDQVFLALHDAYDSEAGGQALREARAVFDRMLHEALIVSDDIQKKATNQQVAMRDLDIKHRNASFA